MTDMLFDTQKMVERLEGAGVPSAQARMHTALLGEAISALQATILDHCASKEDLARVETRLETALANTKSDLMRWVVTVGILQMALIAGLMLKLT